jgi:hypothetical protein
VPEFRLGDFTAYFIGLFIEYAWVCVPRTPSLLIKRPNRLTSAAMIALLCFFLTLFASPFKSKSRYLRQRTPRSDISLSYCGARCAVVSNSRTAIACSWSGYIDGFHRC